MMKPKNMRTKIFSLVDSTREKMIDDLVDHAIRDEINAEFTEVINEEGNEAVKETEQLIEKNERERGEVEKRYAENGKKAADREWLKNLKDEHKALTVKLDGLKKNIQKGKNQANDLRRRARAYYDKADFIQHFDVSKIGKAYDDNQERKD